MKVHDLPENTTHRAARQEAALVLHSSGKTTSEIAAQLGVSYALARDIQLRMGVTPHRAPKCKTLVLLNAAHSRAMTERRAQIAQWLRADPSLTNAQLAEATGVTKDTIKSDRLAVGAQAQSEQGARHRSAGTETKAAALAAGSQMPAFGH